MKVPAISSYGLFWERKEDNFLTGKIKIKQGKPGRPRKGAKLHKKVTLNGRRGIYILYSQEREILYCGMGKINERLLAHHKEYNYTNAEQSSRGLEKMWKIFSWFEISMEDPSISQRPELTAEDDDTRQPSLPKDDLDRVCAIVEAILIESCLPPFNSKGGIFKDATYVFQA